MKFTVFGGNGFIGRHVVRHLQERHENVCVPPRDVSVIANAGHVIFAIGVTANFRTQPFDAVEGHVAALAERMRRCEFDSWLYLSSTRVYSGLDADATATEDGAIPITPSASSLYDLCKLLGESLCTTQSSNEVRVVRLSNVYGAGQSPHTFLGSIIRSLRRGEDPVIREAPDSGKDYISVTDLPPLLEAVALRGKLRSYNVASGKTVSHAELAVRLGALTGRKITFAPHASRRRFPKVDISRIAIEFDYRPASLLDELPDLLDSQRPLIDGDDS